MKRISRSDKMFLIIDHVILTVLLIAILYPLIYIIMASFSAGPQYMTIYLIPKKFSTAGYQAVLQHRDIWTGYLNSLINVVLKVVFSLAVTMMCAYPLACPEFRARKGIMALCMFTMYFGGGLIPNYLLIRDLGLVGNRMALILPGVLNVYNMIIARTYIMSSIPGDIRESAQIEGCGNIRYLISMVVPLSKPVLAVLGLFCAVGEWNAYFDAMIYLNSKRELFPLALILREILVLDSEALEQMDIETVMALQERRDVMKYALIVVASVPVMMIYPFIQKYFVKGMMIGSVKG